MKPMTQSHSALRKLLLLLLPLAVVAVALPASSGYAAPPAFADSAFSSLWRRTDSPVASGAVRRTWFWGPQPNTGGIIEEYKEGAGGKRLVQYFDKSRMEINDPAGDPASPFYVTNGLLTVELISGRMQTGKATFQARQPSRTNVTGDAGDPLAPTYADLSGVSNAVQDRRDPDRTGKFVTATLGKDGKVGDDPSKSSVPGIAVAYYENTTGHNVPRAMWDFLNSTGPVSNDSGAGTTQARLINPWFYASGLPISDAYWVRATIAGKPTDVLVQAFERRVLTYVPTNPAGFQVEMGNIGQHYYQWRYGNGATPVLAGTPTATVPASGSAAGLSRYAVDTISDLSPALLDKLKAGGAGAIRVYISWADLEPQKSSPDQFKWDIYDGMYKLLSDKGLQPITTILSCPQWACARPDGPVIVERVPDFVQFMTAVVGRYSKSPYNAHYWEFWNEPDSVAPDASRYNWGTHGDRYAAMLGALQAPMKQADPSAKLVMGGLSYDNFLEQGGPFNKTFLDDVLKAGGGQYLDVFNFHYYVQNVNWCSFTAKLNELRAKLKAYNLNVPIMSTESGFTSGIDVGSNDDTQSAYVAQLYAQTAGEGMLSTTWFLAKDFPGPAQGKDIFQKSGLLDASLAPKPSYNAYKVAVAELGQRPVARVLGAAEGITGKMRGYEFQADANHKARLWTVWAWDVSTNPGACGTAPAPRDFVVPANLAPNVARVLDLYGQPVPTRVSADKSIVFSLDARPVYIEWAR